jgi:hypothetical protein
MLVIAESIGEFLDNLSTSGLCDSYVDTMIMLSCELGLYNSLCTIYDQMLLIVVMHII